MLHALDTETTGLHLFHNDRPFFLSITSEDGTVREWNFPVVETTRIPIVNKADRTDITDIVMDPDNTFVLHNTKFDTRALVHITNQWFDPIDFIGRCEDTLLMSHILDSFESHGLKDLALKYCDIADDDMQYLKQVVTQARLIADRLGWKTASKGTMPLLSKAPNDGWWVCDMWVPGAVYNYMREQKNKEWCQSHLDWKTACSTYCNQDTFRTLSLYYAFYPELERQGYLDLYEEQKANLAVTYKMERRGVSFHQKLAVSEINRLAPRASEFEREAAKIVGLPELNVRSTQQVADVLYNKLKLPISRQTDSGNPSADAKVLEAILSPDSVHDPKSDLYQFALNVFQSKKCQTSRTYLLGYLRVALLNRLHPNYNLTGTHTTRLSSNDPNGQNISKGKDPFVTASQANDLTLRKVFGPSEGREWWTVDYKQLQLLIFACVSGETVMKEKLIKGYDAHDITSRLVFQLPDTVKPDEGQRRVGKTCNFGFIFGAGRAKIEETSMRSGVYDTLKERMPNAVKFIAKCSHQAKHNGKVFAAGYPLVVPSEKPHAASCYVIQGWEGRIVKRAMIYCDRYLEENCNDAFITLNVHDELVFDFPAGQGDNHIAELCHLMELAGHELDIPCQVDAKYVSHSWDKGIPVEFN